MSSNIPEYNQYWLGVSYARCIIQSGLLDFSLQVVQELEALVRRDGQLDPFNYATLTTLRTAWGDKQRINKVSHVTSS